MEGKSDSWDQDFLNRSLQTFGKILKVDRNIKKGSNHQQIEIFMDLVVLYELVT